MTNELLTVLSQVIIVDGSQDSQSLLPTSIKNFSLSQKEKTLDELIRDRWLSYTSTGKIGLGTRSFLDLRSWFCGNDIPSCVVCNEACIKVLIRDDFMIFSCLGLVISLPSNLQKLWLFFYCLWFATGIKLSQWGMQCKNSRVLSEEEIFTAKGSHLTVVDTVTLIDVKAAAC